MTAPTSATGWCTHDRHTRCRYGPSREFPDGIGLSGGGTYMCPCGCHSSGVPIQTELFNEEEL